MRRPNVRPPLPGPKARAVLDRCAAASSDGASDYSLVPATGEGCWVTDLDGNEFLDMTTGTAASAVGHGHPSLSAAIEQAAHEMVLLSASMACHASQVQLSERLAALGAVRGEPHRVHLVTTGGESLSAAVRIARAQTGRPAIITFLDASVREQPDRPAREGSVAVDRTGVSQVVTGVYHAVYPDAVCDGDEATAVALEHVGALLGKLISPDQVAAFVVEPVQCDSGYVVAPDAFLVALRRLCDQHDILLVCDETRLGPGRTGKMLACQHTEVMPDLSCLAHGLAGGLPLGAVLGSDEVLAGGGRLPTGTFAAHPLSCAAALATLDLLDGGLVENAAELGTELGEGLQKAMADRPRAAAIRGRGLARSVELGRDSAEWTPDPELRDAVVAACCERGLWVSGCGASAVRFSPALTVSSEEVALAVELFDAALRSCTDGA